MLGKNGMLGSEFTKLLSKKDGVELIATDKDGFDITDARALEMFFDEHRPQVVINCAAYTFVDNCETNSDLAFKVNAEAPKNMAKFCKKHDAILIHFSTDYVFAGEKKDYFEEDIPSPISVYGNSKYQGEKNIAAECEKFYIVRISTLFGEFGNNFVKKIYEAAKTKNSLDVVDDYVSCPTYAKDLAERIVEDFVSGKLKFGIYHLTNEGTVSRYEFAREIIKLAGLKTEIKPILAIKEDDMAARPHWSILKTKKVSPLRHYEEALKFYLDLIK